jgi:signal transduction histidine kinase
MFDIAAALSAVSATLRRDPARPEAEPEPADTLQARETLELDRDRVCELRREIRERRGVEAALKAGQSELKAALADCTQELNYLVEQNARLEDKLRQTEKMAAVGRLAGGVAHDFNNVLGVIAGNAELLLRHLEPGSPHRRRVEALLLATQRGTGLTRQILTFSRKTPVGPKALDLANLVTEMKGMLEQMIGEDVRLVVSTENALGTITADPGRIEQVLMNLAVNARDAMPRGGELKITLTNDDGHVCMDVTDNGCGMDADIAEQIFEPFFTTKDATKGTGLGLATVHEIVTQSDGQITVDSARGQGTVFHLRFPRVGGPVAAPVPADASPAVGRATGLARETILLVEDEEFLRELMEEALVDAGYVVLSAASGAEALEKARAHAATIHLTLTDVVMPGMSGRELVRNLDPVKPGVRALYMSGYEEDDILRRGLIDPGAPLMHKPFNTEILLEQVRTALTQPRCGIRTETSLAAIA